MDRYWLLTWTTYGTWLPGDRRGFVSELRDEAGEKVLHNRPGTPCDKDLPPLHTYAAAIMTGDAVRLDVAQARAVADQLRETATHRGWQVLALAVMANHVHVLVGVPGDPDPEKLLGDFKAWATRRLNTGWGRRDRWWTQSGSRRKKQSSQAIRDAVLYVRDQPHALVVWLPPAVVAALARASEDSPVSGAP
jgi:REP element-mobilizing transposase RayT